MKLSAEAVRYSKKQLPQVELNEPYLAVGVNADGHNWIGEGESIEGALSNLYSIADSLVGDPVVIKLSVTP